MACFLLPRLECRFFSATERRNSNVKIDFRRNAIDQLRITIRLQQCGNDTSMLPEDAKPIPPPLPGNQ